MASSIATTSSPSLCIPDDILYIICKQLVDDDHAIPTGSSPTPPPLNPTLHTLALLSRQFYFVLRPFLHHSICLSSIPAIRGFVQQAIERPTIIATVRSITVVEPPDVTSEPNWPAKSAWGKPETGSMPWSNLDYQLTDLWKEIERPEHERPHRHAIKSLPQRATLLELVYLLISLPNVISFRYFASKTRPSSPFPRILSLLVATLPYHLDRHHLPHIDKIEIAGIGISDWSPDHNYPLIRRNVTTIGQASADPGVDDVLNPNYFSSTLRDLKILVPFLPDSLCLLMKGIERLEVLHYFFCPRCVAMHRDIPNVNQALLHHRKTLKEVDVVGTHKCSEGSRDTLVSFRAMPLLAPANQVLAQLDIDFSRYPMLEILRVRDQLRYHVPSLLRVTDLTVASWSNPGVAGVLRMIKHLPSVAFTLERIVLQGRPDSLDAGRVETLRAIQTDLRRRGVEFTWEAILQ